MGNSGHGTAYVRVGGDDGELRPWTDGNPKPPPPPLHLAASARSAGGCTRVMVASGRASDFRCI